MDCVKQSYYLLKAVSRVLLRRLYLLAHGGSKEINVVDFSGRIAMVALQHPGCCMGILFALLEG